MRLASVRHNDRDLVAIDAGDDRVVAIETVLARVGHKARPPISMRELIAAGDEFRDDLAAAWSGDDYSDASFVPADWYPPIRHPGKILAVAMNNSASNARKISAPEHPAFFLKPPSCLIGHLEPVRIRSYYGSVHPEPELAVVIGRRAHDVAPTEALEAVYGYSIFDDITGNGMRAEDRFHYYAVYARKDNPDETEKVEQHLSYAARYKGTDCFGVLGPWLVTRDDVPNPDDLDVHCTIHGEVIAEDSTRYYNYKVAEVISFISQFQTLMPGDVLSLGTAFKPSASRKSIHHANLQTVPGPIEIEIAGLGRQQSPVVVEQRELAPWRLK
jgi:2,4-diketo-3-deoxy-L-fuconate hydrolase